MTRVSCSFQLFLCVGLLFCVNVFSSVTHADVETTGNVEPADPASWTAGTPARVGNTADGTLTVNGGSEVMANTCRIGNDSGVTGVATITGANTWLMCNIETHVGYSGNGTLNITDGGRVWFNSFSGYWDSSIGYNAGSTGVMNVDGAGSEWEYLTTGVESTLNVGRLGDGTLNLTNGGTATNSVGRIGYFSGSTGVVNVDGAGSEWTLWGNTGSFNGTVTVGSSGNGTLNITNGGAVSITRSGYIGAYSTGVVSVDGTGSTWTLKNLYLGNGANGNGTMKVTNGATVSSTGLGIIGSGAGAKGFVTVDGTGSILSNSGSLKVGSSGDGILNISSGGQVGTGQGVSVASASKIAMSVTNNDMFQIGTAGTYDLTNDGVIALSAAPGLASGVYSPISVTGDWLGSGSYDAFGGVWDDTAHTFTVATAQTTTSGVPVNIDLANTQRIEVGTKLVANFEPAGGPTSVDFTATEISGVELLALEALLDPGHVINGWDFDILGLPIGDEVSLSLAFVGDPDGAMVWHNDGSGWAEYETELVYSNGWASFTVDSFSSYAVTGVPEPGTLPFLVLGGLGWLVRRRRRN